MADPAHPGVPHSAQADRPHLLVVDDDARLSALLQKYLSENGFRITIADGAAAARARLKGLSFDLIILDVMMPGENGLDLTRDLRRHSDIPILLLTARGEAADRIKGLEHGADDYLAKPFEPRELVLRVNTILRRAKNDGEGQIIGLGRFRFDRQRREVVDENGPVSLPPAAAALLAEMATECGRPISREALSKRLGNQHNPRSIDVLVARLRRHIEVNPHLPRYIRTVRGHGYMLQPD